MANLNRVWKRWMATGCPHSIYLCKEYRRNVLAFKNDFKPAKNMQLGDVLDTTCLRTGARGTKDEAEPLEHDLAAGFNWMRELMPDEWILGNHDVRPYELMDHPSGIISELSKRLVQDMRQTAASIGCKMHESYDIEKGWVKVGDIYMGHGFMYNINALRDHVEMTGGKTCIAHLHHPHIFRGRMLGSPWGVCVGSGADPQKMGYARRRRNSLTHGHGIAYGEYCADDSTMHLLQWNCAHGANESPRWLIS